MDKQSYVDCAENAFYKTYNRYGVVIEKGEGTHIYDVEGKKYLDFGAGIAVFAFGYGNKEYNDALKDQIDKIIHTSNYFYNIPSIDAASKLKEVAGMDRVFFTNSGAESIEGALKIAKKYGHCKDGRDDHEIIAFEHSFHGRTLGALSVTGTKKYREPFEQLIPGIKFATYNDLESVKALVNEKTCAILMETVQGEGGIYPATNEFIEGVRKLCDDNDMLMISDEIQCGMGRTGKMFAYQHYNVMPDVVTAAKALGCGVPVGAFMARGKAAKVLEPGDHGTTYGGNPLATRAVSTVLDMFKKYDTVKHVNDITPYLEKVLDGFVQKYDFVTARRGLGLMQGLVCGEKAADVVKSCSENGLILFMAGHDVVRFVPRLVITREDIDEMAEILDKVLASKNS